jgi:GTP-binding protein
VPGIERQKRPRNASCFTLTDVSGLLPGSRRPDPEKLVLISELAVSLVWMSLWVALGLFNGPLWGGVLSMSSVNRPKEQRNPQKLQFLTSAVDMQGCPADTFPEVAIVGRSNAGKSTLINGISNSRIAQVSAKPGKTRLLNFYQAPTFRLVDMPGYGFSSRSGHEQKSWQKMIEPYLSTRETLVGLLIVMDIRRDWSQDEEDLLAWMAPRELPAAVVLTKADKLSRGAALQKIREIQKASDLEDVMATSSLKRTGFLELSDFVFAAWVKDARGKKKS